MNHSKDASAAKKDVNIQSLDADHKFAILNTICAGDLKKTISEYEAKSVQSNSMGAHITGPHSNKNTGKSHWVVVYGDFGQAFMLKAHLIGTYLETLFK
jgi:hypothetical protein